MLNMSDVSEITALVHSYALLLDQGHVDAVAALFEHSTWRSDQGGRVLRGSEEVRPVYEKLKSYESSPGATHLLTNLTIEVESGGRTAFAQCYWTVLRSVEPGRPTEIILTGQYIDKFEKVEDAWRFADRFIKTDLTDDTSDTGTE
jgi:hypothetical protein